MLTKCSDKTLRILRNLLFSVIVAALVLVMSAAAFDQAVAARQSGSGGSKSVSVIMKPPYTLPPHQRIMFAPIVIDVKKSSGPWRAAMSASDSGDFADTCNCNVDGQWHATSGFNGFYDPKKGTLEGDLSWQYSAEGKDKSPNVLKHYTRRDRGKLNASLKLTIVDDSTKMEGKIIGPLTWHSEALNSTQKPIDQKTPVDWNIKAKLSSNPAQALEEGESGNRPDTRTGGLVRGKASLRRGNIGNWHKLSKDRVIDVRNGDWIRTGPNTRLMIKYPDGSFFRVKSNSTIIIRPMGITLKFGDAWFNLTKQGKEFKVITPTTVLGVLGTKFLVSHDADNNETLIELAEGSLSVDVTGDTTRRLSAGERLVASKSNTTINDFNADALLAAEAKTTAEDIAVFDKLSIKNSEKLSGLSALLVPIIVIVILVSAVLLIVGRRRKI